MSLFIDSATQTYAARQTTGSTYGIAVLSTIRQVLGHVTAICDARYADAMRRQAYREIARLPFHLRRDVDLAKD